MMLYLHGRMSSGFEWAAKKQSSETEPVDEPQRQYVRAENKCKGIRPKEYCIHNTHAHPSDLLRAGRHEHKGYCRPVTLTTRPAK